MAKVLAPGELSIPRSVFHKLVKEVVQDERERRAYCYPTRISAKAVKELQKTAESYLSDIFEKTELPENKILTLETFQTVRAVHDQEEAESVYNRGEHDKTILTFDEDNDVIIE